MSKSQVKAVLKSMDKDEIISMVMDMYSARKEAREYLDFYAEPDEKAKLEEYKKIIRNQFYPSRGFLSKTPSFSVCRKAVSDFKKLKPSEDSLADLMLYYAELACEYAYDWGNMGEQYYESVEKNFGRTLVFIVNNDLWDKYHDRIKNCIHWASRGGWGFGDCINEMYFEMEAICKEDVRERANMQDSFGK